jgi:carbon storage regulator
MLILSRKPGERVLVGEDVEVIVLEVDGDRVKLGFEAPRYVPICRAEIHRELADCLTGTGKRAEAFLGSGGTPD